MSSYKNQPSRDMEEIIENKGDPEKDRIEENRKERLDHSDAGI